MRALSRGWVVYGYLCQAIARLVAAVVWLMQTRYT